MELRRTADQIIIVNMNEAPKESKRAGMYKGVLMKRKATIDRELEGLG
jgi:hypothetical protein